MHKDNWLECSVQKINPKAKPGFSVGNDATAQCSSSAKGEI
jgi:hypothetical protein